MTSSDHEIDESRPLITWNSWSCEMDRKEAKPKAYKKEGNRVEEQATWNG